MPPSSKPYGRIAAAARPRYTNRPNPFRLINARDAARRAAPEQRKI